MRRELPVFWLPVAQRLALLRFVNESATWVDGRASARGVAAAAKRCDTAVLPATMETLEATQPLREILDSQEFRDAALPKMYTQPRFVRYKVGDRYDLHTDEVMNADGFRADLSYTIVLQAADEGGLLRVGDWTPDIREGDCYLYPTTREHEVTEVLAGTRIVAIGWVHSQVRDAGQRELLATLNRIAANPGEATPAQVQAVRNELFRRWCS